VAHNVFSDFLVFLKEKKLKQKSYKWFAIDTKKMQEVKNCRITSELDKIIKIPLLSISILSILCVQRA
jgi:hypothetical protein